jgi:hypothetical protein
MLLLTSVVEACGSGAEDSQAGDSVRQRATAASAESRCYRSRESVLLGPGTTQRSVGHAPGWIRLEASDQSSGSALLVDGNGAGLTAQWQRVSGDTLHVVARDDLLRTELFVVAVADSLQGRATAHSDADVERDSTGALGDLRRAWRMSAARAPCDSMPRRQIS